MDLDRRCPCLCCEHSGPARGIPACSDARPANTPGLSARKTRVVERITDRDEVGCLVCGVDIDRPAVIAGWCATTPTTCPTRRAHRSWSSRAGPERSPAVNQSRDDVHVVGHIAIAGNDHEQIVNSARAEIRRRSRRALPCRRAEERGRCECQPAASGHRRRCARHLMRSQRPDHRARPCRCPRKRRPAGGPAVKWQRPVSRPRVTERRRDGPMTGRRTHDAAHHRHESRGAALRLKVGNSSARITGLRRALAPSRSITNGIRSRRARRGATVCDWRRADRPASVVLSSAPTATGRPSTRPTPATSASAGTVPASAPISVKLPGSRSSR